MSASLATRREERVLHLTLRRPEKRNALNVELCRALTDACEDADTDPSIGAILIDAEGEVFCAGMDLDEVLSPDAARLTPLHERLFTLSSRLSKPMVAAVQGSTLGGGVGFVANAHVVLAAEGSTFGLTEIRIGMWPFVIFRAVAGTIGERRTVELSLTGRMFSAADALQWGLVSEIVAPADLGSRAMESALRLSNASAEAIRQGLSFVRESHGRSLSDAGGIAAEFRSFAFRSADFAEGVKAFREKREPRWPSVFDEG